MGGPTNLRPCWKTHSQAQRTARAGKSHCCHESDRNNPRRVPQESSAPGYAPRSLWHVYPCEHKPAFVRWSPAYPDTGKTVCHERLSRILASYVLASLLFTSHQWRAVDGDFVAEL